MKTVRTAAAPFSRSNSEDHETGRAGKVPVFAKKSSWHVLVVDDEPLIRWSVSESLSEMGLDVEQAATAGAALRTATTTALPFDAVVLDLRLPDMEDLSLLRTLRQLLPHAVLILMTAFGTAETIADAEALGAEVLNKPFELDELKHLIIGSLTPCQTPPFLLSTMNR